MALQIAKPKQEQDEHAFLGEEFLLWLWWSAETRGGVYPLSEQEGGQVGVSIDRRLEFYDEATNVRVSVNGDAPTRAPEAREALARGMRLARAGLVVATPDTSVDVTFDAATFDLRSVKAPRAEGDSREERDGNALATLFGLTDALDGVYRRFLLERTGSAFKKDGARELQEWARGKSR